MIELEKGIAIPTKRAGRPPVDPIYPWDKMGIGDSLLGNTKSVPCAPAALKKRGWKFATRVIDGRCRVWRIA